MPRKKKDFPYTVAVQGHIMNSYDFYFRDRPLCKEEIMTLFCDEKFGPKQTEDVPGIESYQYGNWCSYNYANQPFTFAFRNADDAVLFKLRFADWLYQKPTRRRRK